MGPAMTWLASLLAALACAKKMMCQAEQTTISVAGFENHVQNKRDNQDDVMFQRVALDRYKHKHRAHARDQPHTLVKPSKSCTTYSPGMNLIKLPDLKRQFLLFVPRELVESETGVPLVIVYHGFSDNPWYINQAGGYSNLMERYGWLGMFPFGLNESGTNGLGGVRACCNPNCDSECCQNGLMLNKKDETACGWQRSNKADTAAMLLSGVKDDAAFTEALVQWAKENTCTDSSKVFATGFSNGGSYSNWLGCNKAHLFRAVAPISGDDPSLMSSCAPSKPISYISMCGSADDEAKCQLSFGDTAKHWSQMMACSGDGPGGAPVVFRMSATSRCTQWSHCKDGNFVEYCTSEGLPHNVSGHLRPDDISYIRPGSDIDFPGYSFQRFSMMVDKKILFWGHPTAEELAYKQSKWPPPQHDDHQYLRQGRLLGKDHMEMNSAAKRESAEHLLLTCLVLWWFC